MNEACGVAVIIIWPFIVPSQNDMQAVRKRRMSVAVFDLLLQKRPEKRTHNKQPVVGFCMNRHGGDRGYVVVISRW